MKLILLQDVKGLGPKGHVVDVADGYGRNFLLPRKLAVVATPEGIREVASRQKQELQKKERELAQAQELAGKLDAATINISGKAGENDKLFGSVTSKEIAQAITRQLKCTVDKRKIYLEEPIKALGVYPAAIKLHPQVTVEVKVRVMAE